MVVSETMAMSKKTKNPSCASFEISTSFTSSTGTTSTITDYHNSNSKFRRTKSLSNIDNYTAGDIRRIRERLLRTNSHVEASTIRNFTKKQKLTLASLALVDFISFCSMSIMAPFFPKEATEKGLTDTLSGFIFSFYAIVMFISSPIFGKIIPRFGAKFLFLSGMFMAGICNILFGILEFVHDYTLFTTLCITIRGFEALGASAFSTASYVFVVNTFPNNIGSVLGILETFVGLGMSTGPAIGGILYSVGGFDLPFFVLGIIMILFVPFNVYLLPKVDDCNIASRPTTIWKLIKIPDVVITSLVVVIVSSTWAFLDPTLEPHLRQFNLTPEKIGLIFLLFSGIYGISSPLWGWLADKVNNHWSMMVIGLFLCTFGLLLLGPAPFLTFLNNSLWLNLVALSILGVSVALALLPTFQSVLTSAINSGCSNTLSTYSIVAGIWACTYSLGEVIGPSLGGFLMQNYGFPVTATIMASLTLILGIVATLFFVIKAICSRNNYYSNGDSSDCWTSTTNSNNNDEFDENSPLILTTVDSSYRLYTEDKVQLYEKSRRLENEIGEKDNNQVTDIRGTVAITAKGSCEV